MNRPMSEYPISVVIPVQWGDQDAMGHVNHTLPMRWFETARVTYLGRLGIDKLAAGLELGVILAAVNCNYTHQLRFPDTIHAATRVSRIGRTSFTMQNEIYSESIGGIAADGEAVLVVYDYQTQHPVPIPERLRTAIEAIENRSPVKQ